MAGEFHDYRLIDPGFSHVGVKRMSQVMEVEVFDTSLL